MRTVEEKAAKLKTKQAESEKLEKFMHSRKFSSDLKAKFMDKQKQDE